MPLSVRQPGAKAARSGRPSRDRSPRAPEYPKIRSAAGFQPVTMPSWLIVTIASSELSSIARRRDSLSTTSASACRRATSWPTWLPRTLERVEQRLARARAGRGRRTRSRRRRRAGPRRGKANAARRPALRAASARGKFASLGGSTIHAGLPGFERPDRGAPHPGRRTSVSLSASNSVSTLAHVPVIDAAEAAVGERDLPDRAEVPSERAADRGKQAAIRVPSSRTVSREDSGATSCSRRAGTRPR